MQKTRVFRGFWRSAFCFGAWLQSHNWQASQKARVLRGFRKMIICAPSCFFDLIFSKCQTGMAAAFQITLLAAVPLPLR